MRSQKNSFNNIVVLGTDTGIGKTVLSLCLMKFFLREKYQPFYLKPFQTGCDDKHDPQCDANFIGKNLNNMHQNYSTIYCYKYPLAPYFAARRQNCENEIDLSKIENYIKNKLQKKHPIIIEAAGGVLVPITSDKLFIDIIDWPKTKTIIAAQAGLGTINHTLLTLEALQSRNISPIGVIFFSPDNDVSKKAISENKEAIEKFSNTPVLGTIHKVEDFKTIKNSDLDIFNNIFLTE